MDEEELRMLRRERLNDYLKIDGGFSFRDILRPPSLLFMTFILFVLS